MHRILVVSLLTSSALVAAAATPQPPSAPASGSAANIRISTGVVAPQISSQAIVHIPGDDRLNTYPNPAKMLVRLHLDASGNATGIQVIESLSPRVDAGVIAAVQRMHWRPAVLDGQPIPLTVNLTVAVEH